MTNKERVQRIHELSDQITALQESGSQNLSDRDQVDAMAEEIEEHYRAIVTKDKTQ